jgi:hypothetical protein
MKHITLASDTKFLLFGITLIRSVQKHSSIPLTFHYYCMDQNTFERLQTIQLKNVILYPPETLVSDTFTLVQKSNF